MKPPYRRPGYLGGKAIMLAQLDDAYERRYVQVLPGTQDIPGEESEFSADALVRPLAVDSWSGGESQDGVWSPDAPNVYGKSSNVRPLRVGDGLELGAAQTIPQDDAAADFTEGFHLAVGQGVLWAVKDGSAADWQPVTGDWNSTTISTGATTNLVASISDGGSDGFMYSSHATKFIHRWKTGTTETWVDGTATAPTYVPVLILFQNTLYALDGDDLYSLDKTVAATAAWSTVSTQVSDTTISGDSAAYLNDTASYLRLSKSDVGPIWVQRGDNGQTFIHEYNHYNQTTRTVGRIPYDFIFPYDINFFLGYVFVAFRFTPAHAVAGDAYLFYKRGAQQGLVGPFRSTTGSTASKKILIGGMIGNDVIVYFDGAVWAYDLSSGGVSMLATKTTTVEPGRCRAFGPAVYLSGVTSGANTYQVERFDTKTYTTQTATLESGRWHAGFPGVDKILLDIKVTLTTGLPANTSVKVGWSADGAAFTDHSTTWDTDGETSKTFTVSTNSSTVKGDTFNIRLTLATTAAANTPTVAQVTARFASAQKYIEWRLLVDMAPGHASEGQARDPRLTIPNLNTQVASNTIQQFKDPWQVPENTAAETFDVWVLPSSTPQIGRAHV